MPHKAKSARLHNKLIWCSVLNLRRLAPANLRLRDLRGGRAGFHGMWFIRGSFGKFVAIITPQCVDEFRSLFLKTRKQAQHGGMKFINEQEKL